MVRGGGSEVVGVQAIENIGESRRFLVSNDLSILKYDDKGLIPAIIQDAETGEVLMVAYMNETSLAETIKTGKTHFWSRSRRNIG